VKIRGRGIIYRNRVEVANEAEWLEEWKVKHKKEVKNAIKRLKQKRILITNEGINHEILELYICKGVKDYIGSGNQSTEYSISIDHYKDWESNMIKPLERIDRTDLRSKLSKVLKKLTKEEAKLISMRVGLGPYYVMKLREIGEKTNKTENQVYYTLKKTVKKMKKFAKNM